MEIGVKRFNQLIAVVAWGAIILQYLLMMQTPSIAFLELNIRFFSYFTIDSNLLVAVSSTAVGFFSSSAWSKFFSKTSTTTALTIYILVVGLIYNVILRPQFPVTGLDRLANELLHVAVPLLYVIYWFFIPKSNLKWANIPAWLIYPLCYCLFILLRGPFGNFYPYPFMNVSKLGLQQVLLNSLGVTTVFLFLSVLFVGLVKGFAKKS